MPPKSTISDFWKRVDKNGNCWLWTKGTDSKGYGSLTFQRKSWRAHRLAWSLTNGPIPKGLYVCHDCDTPPCCNPAHLFLGTQFDNMRDCARKRRSGSFVHPERLPRGSAHMWAQLTEAQVLEIRAAYLTGTIGIEALAARYPVNFQNIALIVMGETWNDPALYPLPKSDYLQKVADIRRDHVKNGMDNTKPRAGKRGEGNCTAKMTEADVRAIRATYRAGGATQSRLAVQYGLSTSAMGYLIHGRTWKHVS